MSNYSFRFSVIENITATTARISQAFAGATRAATSLSAGINRIPNSISQLDHRLDELRRAQRESFDLREIRRFQREIDETTRSVQRLTGAEVGVQTAGGSLGSKLGGLNVGGLLTGLASGAVLMNSLQAAAERTSVTSAITFASGSPEMAASNLKFVRDSVNSLGLPLNESLKGFKLLSGSMMDVPGEQIQKIFHGTASAATAMGLSADDTNGIFLALSQIASKGTVSAEELRGQIGERLPGAFSLAAKAMGVTESKLGKLMQSGAISSKEFLPKFAAELEKKMSEQAEKMSHSLSANLNRLKNGFVDLTVSFGESLSPIAQAVIPKIVTAFQGISDWFSENKDTIADWGNRLMTVGGFIWDVFNDVADALRPVFEVLSRAFQTLLNGYLIPAARWLGEHRSLLVGLAEVIGVAAVAQGAWNLVTTVSTLLTGGLTKAVLRLNATFLANPIFWVVGLLAGLVAGIVYAWNHFEKFRGVVMGMWAVLKEFGSIINDFVIQPLFSLGETLLGVFTFDPSMIAKGIEDGMKAVDKIANSASVGNRLTMAFGKGAVEGAADQTKLDPLGAIFPKSGEQGAYFSIDEQLVKAKKPADGKPPKADIGLNSQLASGKSDGISGGANIRTFNITIHKLIESQTIHTTNLTETATKVGDAVLTELLHVVNDVNYAK